jgi:hypothetical protein
MTIVDDRVWYHVVLSTYGSWLYGDKRGFHTRHHREHVDGDYNNPPPPDKYKKQEKYSREVLKQDPVVLPQNLRPIIGKAIRERLEDLGGLVLCISVGGQHIHLLLKTPKGKARDWAGQAKLHSWHVARRHSWRKKLWAKRGEKKLSATGNIN